MGINRIQEMVNPVYTTAKDTVLQLAKGGDQDAQAVCQYIDFSDIADYWNRKPPEILKCYLVAQEARYEIHNRIVLKSGIPNIVDLPSGYSPRGFRVADAGKQYYGLDLPVVIDAMKEAIRKAMPQPQQKYARYQAVDATNYDSMRAALSGTEGGICIVTEGLLSYFNESELLSMCSAVHRLLSEFGGCWITADAGILEIYGLTFKVLLKGNQEAFQEYMKNNAGNLADVTFDQNSLFTHGLEGAKAFLESHGFKVKAESVEPYLPELRNVDEEEMQALRNAYRKLEIWTMTADHGDLRPAGGDLPFHLESSFREGTFSVSIQGRLDTISAPELLKRFQEEGEKTQRIRVDAEKMSYISSAGLRVFMSMYKALDERKDFQILHVSPAVREILETTGMDQLFLQPTDRIQDPN